jgi:hypothetical protein
MQHRHYTATTPPPAVGGVAMGRQNEHPVNIRALWDGRPGPSPTRAWRLSQFLTASRRRDCVLRRWRARLRGAREHAEFHKLVPYQRVNSDMGGFPKLRTRTHHAGNFVGILYTSRALWCLPIIVCYGFVDFSCLYSICYESISRLFALLAWKLLAQGQAVAPLRAQIAKVESRTAYNRRRTWQW